MIQFRPPSVGLTLSLFLLGPIAPADAGSTDAAKGKRVYAQVCTSCHGIDGRGAGSMNLNPPPADLTSNEVQGKLDAGLFKAIHDGRKNKAMGAWKHTLSDEEINDVIAYVRTLGGGPAAIPKP